MSFPETHCKAAVAPNDISRRLKLSLDRMPPFPPVLSRLMGMTAMDPDDISLPSIADMVETDTLIAGKIIGIANSSFYSRGHAVGSVRQAVIRLGVNRLRNVLLSLSINKVWGGLLRFTAPSRSYGSIDTRSATAILCDILAQRLHIPGAELAFITGLFHDVGELLLIVLFPAQYMELLQQFSDENEREQRERELFTLSHAEISAEATAHWNLPEAVQIAVRFHERAVAEESAEGRVFTLTDILHAADRCATAFGMSVFDFPSKDNALDEALAPLGFKDSGVVEEFLGQLAAFDESDRRVGRLSYKARLA